MLGGSKEINKDTLFGAMILVGEKVARVTITNSFNKGLNTSRAFV
ncbi:hypothetical protein JCM19241_1719 [Vibrio ishigakensis]|uniref:Uncharacterized protein n=1 Tax=Vibrio ishigakensis TaxID=1481914 RepID=A0A0B8QSM6_9VIBR|nr:hypothetical protein JCM19241_1719 [Vibrio ishigakensis]